jgi:hypothetical protein
MTSWSERPGYAVALAFVAGAVIVGGILFFVLTRDGDDDGQDQTVADGATGTAPAGTPGEGATALPTGATTPLPGQAATPMSTGLQDPDEALAAFIRDELASEHIGGCPAELAPGQDPPSGICSAELYRSDQLVTFSLGVPFSEGIGEAVLTRNEDGTWTIHFVQAPPLGGPGVSVGSQAVVFGAGDCLNFRVAPSLSADIGSCQIDGTGGQVVEGPVEAEGHTWWRVEGLGWASGQYLVPVTG